MHRMWTAARKEAVFLAYLVAMPRHLFRMQESVFDEVAKFVEFFIIRPLNETVFLGRYDRRHILVRRLINEGIAVVATIRQQRVRAQTGSVALAERA